MAQIGLKNITLTFAGPVILDDIDLNIEKGERICLLGRNGTGKSTLLRVIAGTQTVDEGQMSFQQGLTSAYLNQEVPQELHGTVFKVVAEGFGKIGEALARYSQITQLMAHQDQEDTQENAIQTTAWLDEMAALQETIDSGHGWDIGQKIEQILSRMDLEPDDEVDTLSAGRKRRVLLAQAISNSPDVLLLDEPTNHLDVNSIQWLEEFLIGWNGTILFVTHDRMFLRKVATRIIELDRGHLNTWNCNYDTYLRRKSADLEAEEQQFARFDKKLAQEEVWIRKGVRERRKRNEGRVRALTQMREDRSQRRNVIGKVQLNMQEAERSGRMVLEAKKISFSYGPINIVDQFSTTIMRGDKVGLIGPNGTGKTTLLKLLLGNLAPDDGTIRHGTKLQVAYFDQLRDQLDNDKSVWENVNEGKQMVTINGNDRHIIGYLQDFLFEPERVKGPIRDLSGGERNRLLLAKIFTQPSNLLVLDEPTNDLDVETLELLEERLMDYNGSVLIVSHDRAFLNNVVTSTLIFQGGGCVREFVGGYDDWVRQRENSAMPSAKEEQKSMPAPSSKEEKQRKLSYKEKQELDALLPEIEEMEGEKETILKAMQEPDFYKKAGSEVNKSTHRLKTLEAKIQDSYKRWETLSAFQE